MPNTFVAELDVESNTCIKQKIALKPGKYTMKFDWAARQDLALSSSELLAKINGKILEHLKPNDYNVNCETIDFELSELSALSEIE
jgi:hypothetical protein